MKAFWITPRAIIITLAVLVLWFVGYKVFAKAEPVKQDDKQLFLQNWTKAWEYKYEEQAKKEQAQKLLEEAEKARIEKEKLLFWTGASLGKIQ